MRIAIFASGASSFRLRRNVAATAGATSIAVLAITPVAAEGRTPCRLETFATAAVSAVVDGRTIVLADGREVRLAGVEVPPLDGVDDRGSRDPHAVAAKDALATLVVGQDIILRHAKPETDRYGRLIAHVFVSRGGTDYQVGRDLVASGHARLAPRAGEQACAAAMIVAERSARQAKLGLWADPRYEIRQAENPASILAERGHFTLVQGKVLSVRESGATIYVNFGRRWTDDFTVTIAKRQEPLFAAAGIEPKKLQGRRILVRGWVEERGGPWIEAVRPEQIEVVGRD